MEMNMKEYLRVCFNGERPEGSNFANATFSSSKKKWHVRIYAINIDNKWEDYSDIEDNRINDIDTGRIDIRWP